MGMHHSGANVYNNVQSVCDDSSEHYQFYKRRPTIRTNKNYNIRAVAFGKWLGGGDSLSAEGG